MTNNRIVRYEFGSFIVDLDRRLLARSGVAIPVPPKALELLIALVERPGQVLTKRRIMERVWPAVFVEESNIAQNISLLRKALDDSRYLSRVIVTVPRNGYQFAMPVKAILDTGGIERSDDTLGIEMRSLVVFPFIGVAAEDVSIGQLLADALANSLRLVPSLVVCTVPPLSPRSGPPPSSDAARARALGAEGFVIGFYERRGTSWHLAVQLFRTSDNTMIGSTGIREEFTTFSEVQEALVDDVLTRLGPFLEHTRANGAPPKEGSRRDAFHHYIRGRHFWNKRSEHGLKTAFQCAGRAVEADPTFARGHVGLADTFNLLGGQHAMLAPREAFPRARAAALRALEIDPSCGEAYASLAFVSSWFDWNHEEAENNFRRAIELKPGYATAHHWYGEALAAMSRFPESFAHFETALALDPLSSAIRTDLAHAYSLAGEHEMSERVLREVLKFDRDFARALVVVAGNRERNGDYAGARRKLAEALQREPQSPSLLAMDARVCALSGQRAEAKVALQHLESLEPRNNVSRSDLASVYAALDDADRAAELIREAFQRREPLVAWMPVHTGFEKIRTHTDFGTHWASRTRA